MSDDTSPVRFNPSKSGYYRDESKSRPSGEANRKDFGKIVSKDRRDEKSGAKKELGIDDDIDEEQAEDIALLEKEAPTGPPPSLFEMSKNQKLKAPKPFVKSSKDDASKSSSSVAEGSSQGSSAAISRQSAKEGDQAEETAGASILAADTQEAILQAGDIQKKASVPVRPFDVMAAGSQDVIENKTKLASQKEKSASEFSREQADLARINFQGASQPADISLNLGMKSEAPLPPVKSIQELINLMVKEAQSMEADGKTDTTITLKHPPIFEGAQLVVTSFNSARGEFNISFENLTQAAQQLVNAEHNKASLLNALEQKGYHVHIVTASTIDQERLFTTNVEDPNKERGQREDGQGKEEEEKQQS